MARPGFEPGTPRFSAVCLQRRAAARGIANGPRLRRLARRLVPATGHTQPLGYRRIPEDAGGLGPTSGVRRPKRKARHRADGERRTRTADTPIFRGVPAKLTAVLILAKSPTFTSILRCLSGGGRRCHPPRYRRLPAVAGGFWTTGRGRCPKPCDPRAGQWREADSNRRHPDFQSSALPAELSRRDPRSYRPTPGSGGFERVGKRTRSPSYSPMRGSILAASAKRPWCNSRRGALPPACPVVAGFQVAARHGVTEPAREGERATVLEAHLAVGGFVVTDLDAPPGQPDQLTVASGLRAALPESLAGVGEPQALRHGVRGSRAPRGIAAVGALG